jgi:hypothetical protein
MLVPWEKIPLLLVLGFGLNLLWELAHCQLYETCRRQSWKQNLPLLTIMSIKDSFFIALFYLITVVLFRSADILRNPPQLAAFIAISLAFSFIDERVSVARGRWEYATIMPRIGGVGITPLLEIVVTGVVSFWLVL